MGAVPNEREPLVNMLRAQQRTDTEMRILLRDSAREAEAIIKRYGPGIGQDVRQAQLDVARQQQLMWRRVGDVTRVGVTRGATAANESVAKLMRMYLKSMGISPEGIEAMIMAQGRAGIQALLARGAANIPLSQQVYKTSVMSGQQLDRMLNALILNGASAKEIATRVRKFVDPRTPGGASYAAMRLGRSELNNAFHKTSTQQYQDNPFVEHVKWNLSRSHPKADECDEYANAVHFRGGEPGVFRPEDVPPKPHPQCFCFLAPQVVPDEEFIKNFKRGKYDSFINRELDAMSA